VGKKVIIDMNDNIKNKIKKLDDLNELHLEFSTKIFKADGGSFFPLDIMALSVIKRSMSLISAFTTLIRQNNYLCAASLLRLQLDSCLRFFAAFIVDDPHALANKVLKGKPIRNIKDSAGEKMTDRYLVNYLSKKYKWMPDVYKSTSGFIHLSEKHLFSIFDKIGEERSVGIRIAKDDENIPTEFWIELIDGFVAATDALFEHLKGWIFTKDNPDIVEKMRNEICK